MMSFAWPNAVATASRPTPPAEPNVFRTAEYRR